jgi:hypothetical protein
MCRVEGLGELSVGDLPPTGGGDVNPRRGGCLGELRVDTPTMYLPPGKYRVAFGGMLRSHPTLATGTAEVEVRDPATPADAREDFTAWGNEVGGLQAGVGLRPGENRNSHHGETVTLVLGIRNVGKEEVKFSYLHPFVEHAPAVTDTAGKPVPQLGVNKEIGERTPGEVTVAPGKEIELHVLKRELRPASESHDRKFSALYGTGKLRVQYEQVLGLPSEAVPGWKLDPTLGTLATGKLDLEVASDPRRD